MEEGGRVCSGLLLISPRGGAERANAWIKRMFWRAPGWVRMRVWDARVQALGAFGALWMARQRCRAARVLDAASTIGRIGSMYVD